MVGSGLKSSPSTSNSNSAPSFQLSVTFYSNCVPAKYFENEDVSLRLIPLSSVSNMIVELLVKFQLIISPSGIIPHSEWNNPKRICGMGFTVQEKSI
jgi:hypothetical protein